MSCTCDREPVIGAHLPGDLGCDQVRPISEPPQVRVEWAKAADAPITVEVYNLRPARRPKIEVNDQVLDAADRAMDCILTHDRSCSCSRMDMFMIAGAIAKAR